MKEIAKFEVAPNQFIYLETKNESTKTVLAGGSQAAAPVVKQGSFREALTMLKPAANALIETLQEINRPEEIQLEMGIQFRSEVRAFVLSGEAESTFKVTLKWRNPST